MKELVCGRWVIPDADSEVIGNGAVLVENGRIVDVGLADTLCGRHDDAVVSGGAQFAVMPGLINAHHHSGAASHVQHGAPDMLLESWLKALSVMRPVPTRLDILLSATRQLQSGVTAIVDLASMGGSEASVAEQCADALEAYDTVGIRCAFGPGIYDQGHLGVGPGACDERFLASLPGDLGARLRASGMPPADSMAAEGYIVLVEDLIGRWRNHGRVEVWFGSTRPAMGQRPVS